MTLRKMLILVFQKIPLTNWLFSKKSKILSLCHISKLLSFLQLLDDLLLADDQPCIEALPIPLQYRVSFDTNFEDRNAYVTGISKYIEEATRHAEFVRFFLFYNNEKSTNSSNCRKTL